MIVHDISHIFGLFQLELQSSWNRSTSSFLATPLPHVGPGVKLQQLDPAPHWDLWGIWTFWTIDLWWFMMETWYGRRPGSKGIAIAVSSSLLPICPKCSNSYFHIFPYNPFILPSNFSCSPASPQVLQKELVPRRSGQSLVIDRGIKIRWLGTLLTLIFDQPNHTLIHFIPTQIHVSMA